MFNENEVMSWLLSVYWSCWSRWSYWIVSSSLRYLCLVLLTRLRDLYILTINELTQLGLLNLTLIYSIICDLQRTIFTCMDRKSVFALGCICIDIFLANAPWLMFLRFNKGIFTQNRGQQKSLTNQVWEDTRSCCVW